MKEYTEEQKFTNYKFLLRSVRELKAGRNVNDDDIQYFKHIRYYCKDFNYANIDISDSKFRTKSTEAEQTCQYLDSYLRRHKTIEASAYVKLLELINVLFDYIVSQEEITTLMEGMKI
jgi:hypothetical protein